MLDIEVIQITTVAHSVDSGWLVKTMRALTSEIVCDSFKERLTNFLFQFVHDT